MAFSTSALSTAKTSSGTISVNDWNVGLGDNLHTGVMRAIAETLTSAATASVSFTSISTEYRHLRLYAMLRSAQTSANYEQACSLRFNGDAAANYGYVVSYLYNYSTAAVVSTGYPGVAAIWAGEMPNNGSTAGRFGGFVIDIPDYLSTSAYKPVTAQNVAQLTTGTTGGILAFNAWGSWNSLTAINQITLLASAGNLTSGCRVTLYGIPYTST